MTKKKVQPIEPKKAVTVQPGASIEELEKATKALNDNLLSSTPGIENIPHMIEVMPIEDDEELNILQRTAEALNNRLSAAQARRRQKHLDQLAVEGRAKAEEAARVEAERQANSAAMNTQPYREILDQAYGEAIPEPVRDVLAAIMAAIPENEPRRMGNPVNHKVAEFVRGLANYRRMDANKKGG